MNSEKSLVNNYFTNQDSKFIKGIAIVLMVMHHLFAFPDRIKNVSYVALLKINNVDIEFIIAQYGKICVSVFLFLSGYGMYYILKNNKRPINRLSKLLINYWTVFILFIPIGFLFFKVPFRVGELILNLLCIKSSYNGEWWFMSMYIVVVSVFIFLYKISFHLNNKKPLLYALIGVFTSAFIIVFWNNHKILKGIIMVICYEGAYIEGYLIAKYNLFNKLIDKIAKLNKSRFLIRISLIIVVTLSIIMVNLLYIYDLLILFVFMICTPIFIFNIINIKSKGIVYKAFIILGQHSTSIWLIHTFFCYYYFQKIIFLPKFSMLIFAVLMILSLIVSICIDNLIVNKISQFLLNKNKKKYIMK
ncbi:MAG: acyltransferase [Clostridiales bacterium]|nr:acyltransferase [Clostridiales bacterium]MDY2729473.1 acyltransferase [Clostridium sp.]